MRWKVDDVADATAPQVNPVDDIGELSDEPNLQEA
jgi:hypothetical protein